MPDQISVHVGLVAVDPNHDLFECAEISRNGVTHFLASKTLAHPSTEFARKAPSRFLNATDDWFRRPLSERANRRPSRRSDPNSPHVETPHE